MSDRKLPLAAMEQIMKDAGSNRVSESAKAALKKVLEEYAEEIAKHAIRFSQHAGRKTVKGEDVELAAKRM